MTVTVDVTPAPKERPKFPAFPGLNLGPGVARLSVNGKPVGETQVSGSPSFNQYDETLDIGSDLGTPVSSEYASPFRFTGKIDKVTVDLR